VKQSVITLTVAGFVEKFVTVTPARLILKGRSDKPLEGTVKIVLQEKYPFKIVGSKAKTGKNITYRLEDYEKGEEKGFLLIVKNQKKEKGRYFDVVTLQTDNQIYQEIVIGIHGVIDSE
jgi:hypothetical protein